MARSSQIQDAGAIARLPLLTSSPTVFQALNPKLAAPSAAAILAVPGTLRLEQRVFSVRASGIAFNGGGAASTVNIQLAFGTDTNPANDTVFASTGALPVPATGAVGFEIEAELLFDSISGTTAGTFGGFVGTANVARTGLSATISGLNGNNEPVFNMVAIATIATANPANYALLNTFAIEA